MLEQGNVSERIRRIIGEKWQLIKDSISSGLEGFRGKEKEEEKSFWEFQTDAETVLDRLYREAFILDISKSENFGDVTFNYLDDHSIDLSIFDRTEIEVKKEIINLNDVDGQLSFETKSLIVTIEFTNISKEANEVKNFSAKITARKKDQVKSQWQVSR